LGAFIARFSVVRPSKVPISMISLPGGAGRGGLRQYAELAQPYIAVALLRLDKINRAVGEGLEPFDLCQSCRLRMTVGDGAPRPPAEPSPVVHRRKRQENLQRIEPGQASP
jgi:hypothetical protein